MVIQGAVTLKFILPPTRNPFLCTTAHEPGRRETWSCGNSFVYAWQGVASEEMARRAGIFAQEPQTLARRLAQVVSMQQAADRAGGSPPSATGGPGSVMSQIRITVDEVGQVDLGGYLTKKVDAKPTVVARSSERKTEESGEDAEKKAELEKKAKRANHLAFMEDLGKTAVDRGYMPPMAMVDAYKASNSPTKVPTAPTEKPDTTNDPSVTAAVDSSSAPSPPKSVPNAPSDRSATLLERGLDLALELD